MVEALALLTGPSLAASPWIVGFDGFTTPVVTNLITGLIAPLLALAAAPAARDPECGVPCPERADSPPARAASPACDNDPPPALRWRQLPRARAEIHPGPVPTHRSVRVWRSIAPARQEPTDPAQVCNGGGRRSVRGSPARAPKCCRLGTVSLTCLPVPGLRPAAPGMGCAGDPWLTAVGDVATRGAER
ncbi:SPW repeat protein [Streptomyces zaomyceticus]